MFNQHGCEIQRKRIDLFGHSNTLRMRSIDRIPELEYMEYKLEILRFYGD